MMQLGIERFGNIGSNSKGSETGPIALLVTLMNKTCERDSASWLKAIKNKL